MRTDILMVTYRKDYDFAWYALRSIKKFATGFGDVLVVVPEEDVPIFEPLVVGQLDFKVKGYADTPGKGMLHHMAIKLEADLWCPRADAILHMDADCLFTTPASPQDYFTTRGAVLYRERYERFRHYAARYSWKECVQSAVGINPEWETMVRHPSVHLRPTYENTRSLIQRLHGDWKKWWVSGRNEFPQNRAEFPTLGAVAIEHFPGLYHFVNYEVEGRDGGYAYQEGVDKVKVFWTHGGVARVRPELEAIIA